MIEFDELPLLTQNKSAADICLLYEDMEDKRTIFRESCKKFIDDLVPDWACEEEPYECDIFIDCFVNETTQLLFKTNITGIYRNDDRELVFVTNEEDELSLNYFKDNELMQLIEEISK